MGVITYDPFPSVPAMSQDAQELVEQIITDARANAQSAVDTANAALVKLSNATFPADLPEPPIPPNILTNFSGTISGSFDTPPDLGSVSITLPASFTPDDIVIPDIISDIPVYTALITGFSIPDAPVFSVPDMPVAPSIDTDFTVSDAPTPDYGGLPDLYTLDLPTFTAPVLDPFTAPVPDFTAVPPDSSVLWTEPAYQAQLATTVKSILSSLLSGATGIAEDVERAIWERDRARLDATAGASVAEANDQWASKGFVLPPGTLIAQVLAITRENSNKVAQASRDVAIKQADLEQSNRQFAIGKALEFEKIFVDIFLAVTQRSFEIAKYAVEAKIQIFNAQIAAFDVENKIFESQIAQARIGLEYAQAQISVYKTRIEAESLKASINKDLIAAFSAKIAAFTSQVEAYRAIVQAATAKVDLQKMKVDLYRAEIDGVVAQVSEKKAEFDAYSSRVDAEKAKASLEESNARVYTARVQAITSVAELQLKQTDAQIAVSGQKLQYAVAELNRLGQLAQEQLAQIQARTAVYEAFTRRGTAEFEADKSVAALNLQAQIEASRVLIAEYQANIQMWTAEVTKITAFASINMEAIKGAGQIASTLAAGALAGTSVGTSFNAGVNRSEASNQSKSESTADNTSTSNNFSVSTSTVHQISSEE